MEAIDHIDLVVSSLQRSLPFYRGLLQPLGFVGEGEIVGERGERVVYLSRTGAGETGAIGLRERQSEGDGAVDRYALGLHHLAIAAPSRAAVVRAASWAAGNRIEIESGPAEYEYTPGYYAVFLHDPDGLKLEIVHR